MFRGGAPASNVSNGLAASLSYKLQLSKNTHSPSWPVDSASSQFRGAPVSESFAVSGGTGREDFRLFLAHLVEDIGTDFGSGRVHRESFPLRQTSTFLR